MDIWSRCCAHGYLGSALCERVFGLSIVLTDIGHNVVLTNVSARRCAREFWSLMSYTQPIGLGAMQVRTCARRGLREQLGSALGEQLTVDVVVVYSSCC